MATTYNAISRFCQVSIITIIIMLQGCAHSSLLQEQSSKPYTAETLPYTVTINKIEDTVPCDDEVIYLRDFIRRNRSFLDWELSAPFLSIDLFDTDLLIDGNINMSSSSRSFGFGKFLAIITCGTYYFLGGPTRYYTSTIEYDFHIHYQGETKTLDYAFQDNRTAYGGLYGPYINMDKKPGIYDAGWNELIRRIAEDRPLKVTP